MSFHVPLHCVCIMPVNQLIEDFSRFLSWSVFKCDPPTMWTFRFVHHVLARTCNNMIILWMVSMHLRCLKNNLASATGRREDPGAWPRWGRWSYRGSVCRGKWQWRKMKKWGKDSNDREDGERHFAFPPLREKVWAEGRGSTVINQWDDGLCTEDGPHMDAILVSW